jgi:hypothetical protein
VARAKRTDRAEARRRYRATLVDDLQPDDQDDPGSDAEATPSAVPAGRNRGRAATTAPSGPVPRPSVLGALRSAFRPTDFRGDIAALPSLLRHRSFLIPLALMLGLAAVVGVTGGNEPISALLSQYVLLPPAVAPVFIAGFLAPRASYLIGGLLGVVSQILYLGLLSVPAIHDAAIKATGSATLDTGALVFALFVAVVGGAFYAAAAAWYKRFLALANPARAARASGKPADKSRRRGGDDRPLLARRR